MKAIKFIFLIKSGLIFPLIFMQNPVFADEAAVLRECHGEDIAKYAPLIPGEAKSRLEEQMTGKSIKLRERNKLVIKGVRSVKLAGTDGEGCRNLQVTYNVTLERKLRRDASGTANVWYELKRGSSRHGPTFRVKNPLMPFTGYDLSHLTWRGEMWWAERTPNSFFEPENIIFMIPYKD